MSLSRLARWHPLLWLAAITLVIMVAGPVIPLDYDDRGLGTLWFGAMYVLTTVFRYSSVVAGWIVGQQDGVAHTILAVVLGVAVYVVADIALTRYAARRTANRSSAPV